MAASLAGSLAVPYAAGVPVPASQQQLRTSLVSSVTHRKTRIMAAKSNPALRYEAGALFSTPSQLLGRNGLSRKRGNTIVVAAANTEATIVDDTFYILTKKGDKVWAGEDKLTLKGKKTEIKIDEPVTFTHTGKENEGSIAGLEYRNSNPEQRLSFTFAWSNTEGDPEKTKLYAKIDEVGAEPIDWDEIKEALEADGDYEVFDSGKLYGFQIFLKAEKSKVTGKVIVKATVSRPR